MTEESLLRKLRQFHEEALCCLALPFSKSLEVLLDSLDRVVQSQALLLFSVEPIDGRLVLRSYRGVKLPAIAYIDRGGGDDIGSRALKSSRVVVQNIVEGNGSGVLRQNAEQKARFSYAIALPILRNGLDIDSNHTKSCDVFELPTLAVLCIFLGHNQSVEDITQFLSAAEPFFSHLYVTCVQQDRIYLRKEIVDRTLQAKDLNSFMYKALQVIDFRMHIEGASIFLWDEAQKLLRLHATSGIQGDPPKPDVYYRRDEERITVAVATNGRASITTDIRRDHPVPGKYEENVEHERQSFAAFPILNWGFIENPNEGRPLGVVRLINKVFEAPSDDRVVSFVWDDLFTLSFFAELVGIVSNYLRRAEQERNTFDRVIHGLKSSIEAIFRNLSQLEEHPELFKIVDDRLQYRIPDTLAHVGDIRWQVRRSLEWYRSQVTPLLGLRRSEEYGAIKLTGDVLATLPLLAKQMAVPLNVKAVE
ncbi:MAG TPA: hypothetical protein VMV42_00115, partial [archaeon]|nr:hypothetical protein [archaeon]